MMASAPVRVFVVVNTANADARPVARSVVEALIESGAHISGVTKDIEVIIWPLTWLPSVSYVLPPSVDSSTRITLRPPPV